MATDSENLLGQLILKYGEYVAAYQVLSEKNALLAAAQAELVNRSNAQAAASGAIAAHQSRRAEIEAQIAQLQSDLNVHNGLEPNLRAEEVNAGQMVVNGQEDVNRANEQVGMAQAQVNQIAADVQSLRDRVKNELDDDFAIQS